MSWKVKKHKSALYGDFNDIVDETGKRINERDDNVANLIAAAPDLLAACKEIDHFFNESIGQILTSEQALKAYHNSTTSDKVKQAIAKAEAN